MGGLAYKDTVRWTRIGVLAAFALVLGYLETFVPIPIPGVKLGLANIAILLCFMRLDAAAAFYVVLVKVLAQGLLFGSPLTFAYSLVGSLLAFAAMAATVRIPGMHPALVSVLGALFHTAGQMLVAAALLGTRFVQLAAPVLMLAALVTGTVCGVLAVRVNRALDERGESSARAVDAAAELEGLPAAADRPVGAILLAFIAFAALALALDEPVPLAVLFGVAVAACWVAPTPQHAVSRGVRAFAVLAAMSALAASVGAEPGGAGRAAAVMVLRLGAVMGMSIAVMGLVSTKDLLSFTVGAARRLEARGVNTQGPLLALNVCLQTLPQLAAGVDEGAARPRIRTLADAIVCAYAQAEDVAHALRPSQGSDRA